MAGNVYSKPNNTQIALQINGTDAFVVDSTGVDSGISITASVASNALTLGVNPCGLRFRSSTLTSGVPTYVEAVSAFSLVVPSGASLGTTNAVQSRLVLLALNNAGTMELAVVNIAGGNDLSETGLISTTAISASATSANVVYSNTARTNVPYRVLGIVDSTQATAGTWVTAPSLVQAVGGQALAAMSSLGYGQKWTDVTASRAVSTTNYNTSGKAISVHIVATTATAHIPTLTINGTIVIGGNYQTAGTQAWITAIVPSGNSYVFSGSTTIISWYELR